MKWFQHALVYLYVLSTASVVFFYHFQVPQNSIEIGQAVYLSEQDPFAPTRNQQGDIRYSLPLDSRVDKDGPGDGWYELEFDYDQADQTLWSLVIPALRMNAEVHLNGVFIGDGGRFESPVARNLRRPLIFTLPVSALQKGSNSLHIRLVSGAHKFVYLSRVYAGPDLELRSAYKTHYFVRITLVIIITVMIVLIGGTIGVLGFIRKRDKEYAYFSVCTLIWALHSFSYFTVDIPVSERLWDWIVFISIGYFSILGGVVYVHRYLGLYLPHIERPVLIAGFMLSVVMLFLPGQWFYHFSYYVWHPLSQLVGTYGLIRMLQAAWKRQSLELHIIAASGMVLVAYAMHDLMLVSGLLDWGRGYIIQYSMPFVLLLFCLMLLRRFIRSIEAVEAMNTTLEQRVEERRIELEQTYAKLKESEHQRLLAEERDRIMRDMHDGVGGQLVSTLTLIKQDKADLSKVNLALQSALQDLRLMIDSLDSNTENLPVLLGMFRSRIEPALQAQGIKLLWQVEAIDDLDNFGSRPALQVLRILQEFVTNSLRHSHASEIELKAFEDPDDKNIIVIDIADNGIGIGESDPGHGIQNMKNRAAGINADLDFRSSSNGTRLRLLLTA